MKFCSEKSMTKKALSVAYLFLVVNQLVMGVEVDAALKGQQANMIREYVNCQQCSALKGQQANSPGHRPG